MSQSNRAPKTRRKDKGPSLDAELSTVWRSPTRASQRGHELYDGRDEELEIETDEERNPEVNGRTTQRHPSSTPGIDVASRSPPRTSPAIGGPPRPRDDVSAARAQHQEQFRQVQQHMESRLRSVREEVREDMRHVEVKLQDSISKLQGSIQTLVDGLGQRPLPPIGTPSRSNGTRLSSSVENNAMPHGSVLVPPKKVYADIMDRLIPFFDVAFNRDTVSIALVSSFFDVIHKKIENNRIPCTEVKQIFQSILMSQPSERGQKRRIFHEGIGLHASAFRKKVLHSILHHARVDTFGRFRKAVSEECTQQDPTSEEENKPIKPNWLREPSSDVQAFVRYKHINIARSHHDMSEVNPIYHRMKEIVKGSDLTEDDIAVYAMNRLYLLLVEVLQDCRRHAPTALFDHVGYLFDDWSQSERVCDRINKNNLRMYWVQDFNSFEGEEYNVCAPLMASFSELNGRESNTNEQECQKFAASRSELEIVVSHDVYVKSGRKQGGIRKHAGDVQKLYRRTINLFDVVGFLVRTMCGFDSRDEKYYDIMQYSVHSMECMYALALLFRDIIRVKKTPSVQEPPHSNVPSSQSESQRTTSEGITQGRNEHETERIHSHKVVYEEIFSIFKINKTTRDRSLFRLLCAVSLDEYKSRNISSSDDMARNTRRPSAHALSVSREEDEISGDDLVVKYI